MGRRSTLEVDRIHVDRRRHAGVPCSTWVQQDNGRPQTCSLAPESLSTRRPSVTAVARRNRFRLSRAAGEDYPRADRRDAGARSLQGITTDTRSRPAGAGLVAAACLAMVVACSGPGSSGRYRAEHFRTTRTNFVYVRDRVTGQWEDRQREPPKPVCEP